MTVTERCPHRTPLVVATGLALYLASATAAIAGGCPKTIDESVFASEAELRKLTSEMAGFGLRSTASRSNEQFIDRLKRHMRRIDGMKIRRSGSSFADGSRCPRPMACRVATSPERES